MDENVLKGNAAIFKCHIPSYVADFIFVSSWLSDDSEEFFMDDNQNGSNFFLICLTLGFFFEKKRKISLKFPMFQNP